MMAGTPPEVVARLGARGFRHLYVDGGVTIRGSSQAGLIQRMIVTRIPVLLGSGIPLFGPLSHDIRLEHVATPVVPQRPGAERVPGCCPTEVLTTRTPHSSRPANVGEKGDP